MIGDSVRQQMPYRCQSRNHGLCASIWSCFRLAAEMSLGVRGLVSVAAKMHVQLLDFGNGPFSIHPSRSSMAKVRWSNGSGIAFSPVLLRRLSIGIGASHGFIGPFLIATLGKTLIQVSATAQRSTEESSVWHYQVALAPNGRREYSRYERQTRE